jgi:hypothetical protein
LSWLPLTSFSDCRTPVSVYGVKAIFDIPIATASRLKKLAQENNLIKVQKNFSQDVFTEAERKYHSKMNEVKNFVYRKKKHRLQLIDTITPLFYFSKRKSLEG